MLRKSCFSHHNVAIGTRPICLEDCQGLGQIDHKSQPDKWQIDLSFLEPQRKVHITAIFYASKNKVHLQNYPSK